MFDPRHNDELPAIPNKRYFTIGEVSELCAVKPHVLRYWEQEFPQLSPVKRRGNRRYYQREDVELVRTIRSLLYSQGYTIGGARQRLSNERREPHPWRFKPRSARASAIWKKPALCSLQFNPQLNLGMIRVRSGRSAVW